MVTKMMQQISRSGLGHHINAIYIGATSGSNTSKDEEGEEVQVVGTTLSSQSTKSIAF